MSESTLNPPAGEAAAGFIARWQRSEAGERANFQSFAVELCELLGIARPEPTLADEAANLYVFEKDVVFRHADGSTSHGRIDLYKAGCFVLEAKQGGSGERDEEAAALGLAPGRRRKGTAVRGTAGWDEAMLRARGQAEQYARALDEWPPFVVVVDVGHVVELYADFAGRGKGYLPFPDARSHRLPLESLADPAIRERLRRVWEDPASLDPSRYAAQVTREVAARLAALARSFEGQGHAAGEVADFLMRCLFTMFAEDVGLLPPDAFTKLLRELRDEPESLARMLGYLWADMDRGDFSPVLREKILRFNGRFFRDQRVLPLSTKQCELLLEAAEADWSHVEPAIFGTLVERALDPKERHKLGAHYTPRAYVERLVFPTIIEPLRDEWEAVRASALQLAGQATSGQRAADAARHHEAIAQLRAFHRRLCELRVLDPACGTGNFLYVTLEHMKRLEGEVLQAIADLGQGQELLDLDLRGLTVDPHQFLGLEVNPRAAAIAELVLWIGYLQWHFRTHGQVQPPEPVLREFRNIECRDALLTYEREEARRDAEGRVVTQWDGESTRPHPTTGKPVPDESARRVVYNYPDARRADWPEADYVVGNPPFVGNWRMRSALGDGYTETLRRLYDEVPETADFVMYWWHKAAKRLRRGAIRRFGFITTNSLTQAHGRRVLSAHLDAKDGISLAFAIPDHPWVDSADGAAVRIAMTVAVPDAEGTGALYRVVEEHAVEQGAHAVRLTGRVGLIHADLTVGADVAQAGALLANAGLSSPGVKLHGAGFIVSRDEAQGLGLGRVEGLEHHIRPYRNGKDIAQRPRESWVIDLFGLTEAELRERYPAVYQWVLERVKPERDAKAPDNKDKEGYARLWWLFGKPRPVLREALAGLSRFIATPETAKHRFFVFLEPEIIPDNMLINFGLDDAWLLGVLSSRVHVLWSLAAGGRLGVGNDPRYNKSRCFEPFPFPAADEAQRARIRALGEELDAHRKRQQAAHPALTLTGLYNVLAKLRSGEALTAKEQAVHEQGLCAVLLRLHDELDQAVFAAYGWPPTLGDEAILARLVALNAARAAEERHGHVRYLRPDFQRRGEALPEQSELDVAAAPAPRAAARDKKPWPATLPERVQALRATLDEAPAPLTVDDLAERFLRAQKKTVAELLDLLVAVGRARPTGDGRFAP